MQKPILILTLAVSAFAQQVDWTSQIRNKPFADAREYRFTRTNGKGASGDLSSAGANSATLTSCPVGVAGANTNHYVYISGGAGTAEAVLITGGTCTSGAATGTLEFTTANTHTGAWAVTSATAGIQETINAVGSRGRIAIPEGAHSMYAPIYITDSLVLEGASTEAELVAQSATQHLIVITTTSALQRVRIQNLTLHTALPKTAGDAIQINGSGGVSNRGTVIDGVLFLAQWNGINIVSGTNYSILNCNFAAGQNYSIYLRNTSAGDDGDSGIINCIIDNSDPTKGAGIRWESGGGVKIANTKILNHVYGVDFRVADGVATSDIQLVNNSIENQSEAAMNFQRLNATGTLESIVITGNQMATTKYGIITQVGGISRILISDNLIGGGTHGILISQTAGVKIDGNLINGATNGIYFSAGNSGLLTAVQNQIIGATTKYTGTAVFVDNLNALTFAEITAGSFGPTNGSQAYCADCIIASPCAGGGTGALAKRLSAAWVCN